MSTIKVNSIQNTAGVEVYTAKAWVNFDGTGTPSIRASGNISSITDLGTGYYTLNFAVAFSNTNYAVLGTARGRDSHTQFSAGLATAEVPGTSSVNIKVGSQGGTSVTGFLEDSAYVFIGIFR